MCSVVAFFPTEWKQIGRIMMCFSGKECLVRAQRVYEHLMSCSSANPCAKPPDINCLVEILLADNPWYAGVGEKKSQCLFSQAPILLQDNLINFMRGKQPKISNQLWKKWTAMVSNDCRNNIMPFELEHTECKVRGSLFTERLSRLPLYKFLSVPHCFSDASYHQDNSNQFKVNSVPVERTFLSSPSVKEFDIEVQVKQAGLRVDNEEHAVGYSINELEDPCTAEFDNLEPTFLAMQPAFKTSPGPDEFFSVHYSDIKNLHSYVCALPGGPFDSMLWLFLKDCPANHYGRLFEACGFHNIEVGSIGNFVKLVVSLQELWPKGLQVCVLKEFVLPPLLVLDKAMPRNLHCMLADSFKLSRDVVVRALLQPLFLSTATNGFHVDVCKKLIMEGFICAEVAYSLLCAVFTKDCKLKLVEPSIVICLCLLELNPSISELTLLAIMGAVVENAGALSKSLSVMKLVMLILSKYLHHAYCCKDTILSVINKNQTFLAKAARSIVEKM